MATNDLKGFRTTEFRGHPNYECQGCGYATLDKDRAVEHGQTIHGIAQDGAASASAAGPDVPAPAADAPEPVKTKK